MGLDGGDAHVQLGGDLGVGGALADGHGDLAFTVVERADPVPSAGAPPARRPTGRVLHQLAGDGGREHGVTGRDPAYRVEDLHRRRVLEDEPGGTRAQRPQHLVVGVKRGEDHDLRRVLAPSQPFGGRESVDHRHPDVHQDDVRAGAVDERLDLAAVRGLADDLDVVGAAHHEGQAGPDQRIVVDEKQPDRIHGAYRRCPPGHYPRLDRDERLPSAARTVSTGSLPGVRSSVRYRLLGRTGLRVSELFLGAMTFGEQGGVGAPKEECARILDAYAEAGGNVVDTAVNYRGGASEEIVGELLQRPTRPFRPLHQVHRLP